MIEARDAGKTEFLTKIISRLEDLPVDFDSLKRCTIGKTVGSLRKHALQNVKASAARVVQKWKSTLGDQSAVSKKERHVAGLPDLIVCCCCFVAFVLIAIGLLAPKAVASEVA